MRVYYDRDADLSRILDKKIAIVGYGSQGRAHALNLSDSGFDVVVGVRKGGAGWKKAKKEGLAVAEPIDAVADADLVARKVQPAGLDFRNIENAVYQPRQVVSAASHDAHLVTRFYTQTRVLLQQLRIAGDRI